MEVIECIKRFDNLINPFWCNLIKNFIDQEYKKPLTTSGGTNKDIRNVEGFSVSPEKYSLDNFSRNELLKIIPRNIFLLKILKLLEIPIINYKTPFRHAGLKNLLQVDFLKYEVGGKYEIHTDRGPTSENRELTVIINLNSGYEGGEFVFFNPLKTFEIVKEEKLKEGSVLMFPSNFLFPHSIQPIIKGTRYSLVCWLG